MIDETELRALVERPRSVHWWGRDWDISPRVIGKAFGDGLSLLTIWALAARPNYFVVRVDSGENFEIRDILDDIYEASEEEYGYYRHLDEQEQESAEFPVVDWGYGTCWSDRYTIEDLR